MPRDVRPLPTEHLLQAGEPTPSDSVWSLRGAAAFFGVTIAEIRWAAGRAKVAYAKAIDDEGFYDSAALVKIGRVLAASQPEPGE